MPGCRLTLQEREVIERGLSAGLNRKRIAEVLGRAASTVGREIDRVGGPGPVRPGRPRRRGRPRAYRAGRAHLAAQDAARRPKPFKLAGMLGAQVAGLLGADWSPEQISAMLPGMFPDQDGMRVSPETIYRSLFVQGRGELRRELVAHLRTHRTARKPRGRVERRGKLIGMVSIRDRPAEVEDRAVPGHWEGDLLLGGTGKGATITLVERTSRFVLLAPLPSRRTGLDVRLALTQMIGRLPEQLRRSLTWDQGKEMADHARFSLDTDIAVYFCDPHSPWQRGSNENIVSIGDGSVGPFSQAGVGSSR